MDDQLIVRYLLGRLPDHESEQLDELSIADEEFAWRVRAVENDLVDSYARGELSGETLERFRTSYLASPQRRGKVQFARAFLEREERASGVPASRTAAGVVPDASSPRTLSRERRRTGPTWALAAAAVLALSAAAYLFSENQRLRQQVGETRAAHADLERTTRGLRTELEQERSLAASIRDELTRLRESVASIRVPSLRPFVLLPLRRGTDTIPAVAVPRDAKQVPFHLRLESDDYPRYEAALRDPASGQIVWRSEQLGSRPDSSGAYVEVQVPSNALKAQNYTLDLSGLPPAGSPEVVGSYAFRAVLD